MKFQSLSFVLSSAAVLAEAAVIGNKSGFPDLERFKIATEVVSGNKKFDGLYMQTYHTGAGTADITFVAGKDNGVDAYFNATHLLFDFHISPGQGGQFFPYAMDLDYSTYSAWGPVTASPGEGDYNAGFSRQASNEIVTSNEEWNGWLVCDWAHLVPQLFWIQTGGQNPPAPKIKILENCAAVELHPQV